MQKGTVLSRTACAVYCTKKAVAWFVLLNLFPVKLKSRRFSKTVASDFGTVSADCVSSDHSLTPSFSFSLSLNDSDLTTTSL